MRKIRNQNVHKRKKENQENHDNDHEKYSQQSKRRRRCEDFLDAQKYRNHKKTFEIVYF